MLKGMAKKASKKADNGIFSGVELIKECKSLFLAQKIKGCEILAASIRNVRQFREVALAGADIVTLPLSVMQKILEHPKNPKTEGFLVSTEALLWFVALPVYVFSLAIRPPNERNTFYFISFTLK